MITGGTIAGRGGSLNGRGTLGRLTWRPAVASAPLVVPSGLALDGNLVTIGDSITAGAFAQNDPYDRAYTGSGFVSWMLGAINHGLRVRPNGNLAVTGNTLSQIRDSLGVNGAILADRAPAVVSFMGGTNNLNDTFTDAQLMSLQGEIVTRLLASQAGLLILWGVPISRPSSPRSANAERQRRLLNAALADKATVNAPRAVFVDPDTLGLGEADFADAVHPSASGARKLGLAGAGVIASRLASGTVSALPPAAAYTANPTMAGTAGLASGWSSSTGSAGGATVEFLRDGTGRQRVLVSGTCSGNGRSFSVDQYTNVAAIGAAPPEGAILEGVLDYELVGSPQGINAIDVLIGINASNYANLAQAQSMLADYGPPLFPTAAGRAVQRTVTVASKAGTPNFLTTRLIVALSQAASASPVSLDLRVNRLEFRRVS